ncbi:zinc finger C3H1 domain-containing protein-like [Lytechinus variegatus]|uniref:zinc finger C3H1 domain-containing protein-like n=1 Tax=Lytechinus variegatus TaxID=7654 RepID=UPI001BB12B4F|nr:zinc finger C3H1 domain-containing protein-like [Lytechinus variegatus]XP_041453122.1 zinc finger C3H1 domain-containing protein-like [Lytechinus variegatus]
MMKVIDEVGGSDEGELEDGEIEEEEGQILPPNLDELSSVVDVVQLPSPSSPTSAKKANLPEKSNENKNVTGDIDGGKEKRTPKLNASRRRESLPKSYRLKETRTTKRKKSRSPENDGRERKRSGSSSSSGKSRAQRRASEAVKRASKRRDRDRESPAGRRSSRNLSRRSRSRSPIIRHQRSYRPLSYEPELAEYERLLRDHRSIQNKIREEKRRLSGGSHSNKSTHGYERGQTSQSKSRGRPKDKSAEKITKKKPDEDNEDEEMMLLQLRKVALASLAKEEKGKEKTDKTDTDDVQISVGKNGDVIKPEIPVVEKQSGSSLQANNNNSSEATILPATGEQDTSVPEGQFDNYEEVEMEVDDEEEEKENVPKPGTQAGNPVKDPIAALDLVAKDEDDDDENLLRAQLLKSMLTKRAAKAQSEKINSSTCSTPSKPLSPATPPLSSAPSPPPSLTPPHRTSTPPPSASTPPTLSRSSSPVPTRLPQQGSSLAGQVPSRAKRPVVPVHLPVVINLEEDSDESEEESSSSSVPFMGQLDSFLKEFRMSSNTQSTKTTAQTAKGKQQAQSSSKLAPVPKTPEAIKAAPTPHRQEYHRLREEIARREHRTLSSKPQGTVGKSELHDRKTHKHAGVERHKGSGGGRGEASGRGKTSLPVDTGELELGRQQMQVRITAHNERQVVKGVVAANADQGTQETAAASRTTEAIPLQVTVNPTSRPKGVSNPTRTVQSTLEAELSRELSAIRALTGTHVSVETHPPPSMNAGTAKEGNTDDEVARKNLELKIAEKEKQREELAKVKMEREKQEEMQRKKMEEMKARRKQVLEWEKKRKEYSLLLKKDKGLIINQEQQIARRRKNINVAKVQLERLREQVAAMEKALSMNQAQMIKHAKQKTALEARMGQHLELDNQARSHLGKLRGVAISNISQSEYQSYLPRTSTQEVPALLGDKRRNDGSESSDVDTKKAKTAGQTADLKKLQDMERHLADKIREFREAEAKKALVGVAAKSVVPENKVKLVRQLSSSKPSAKIYTKDVIKLSAEATAPVDNEVTEVKVEGSSAKGQERRKSWLDANPTLTPNIKSRSKPSTPSTPSVAALGKMKAKFKSEGQRSGQKSGQSSLSDTSLESDLLQWIESSERTGSPVPDSVDTPKNMPLFGQKALKSGYMSRVKKEQKELEKQGPDFLSLSFNQRLPSMDAVGSGCFHVDWCKDTNKDEHASTEAIEPMKNEGEKVPPVKVDSRGLVAYRSSLLPFKAFRLSPLFRYKAGYSVQSPSFTNKLDATRPLCQFELKGTCNDDDCVWQHERDYTMSSREMLTDLLSYNAVSKAQDKDDLTMKNVPASPIRHKPASTEKDKLNNCIEKVLGGNNEGVVSRLISCPRKWRPRPRPRTQRLSSGEADALTEILPLVPPKHSKSSAQTMIRKEAIQSVEEEARYFGGGHGDDLLDLGRLRVHDLEAAVLERPSDVGLWLRLARSLLQESSVDRALNALSRGLELNCNSAPLWIQYLTVYKERAERGDYVEMCLKATELAPCCSTWWMLLEAEYSVLTKLEICKKILQFLKESHTTTTKTCGNLEKAESSFREETQDMDCDTSTEQARTLQNPKNTSTRSEPSQEGDRTAIVNACGETVEAAEGVAGERTFKSEGRSSGEDNTDEGERKMDTETMNPSSDGKVGENLDGVSGPVTSREEISHQALEILLYQSQLHLNMGHKDDAIKSLKCSLSIPDQEVDKDVCCSILVTFDLFLGWLSLMNIHATGSLPSRLFDPSARLPSKIVKKELFSIPWKVNAGDLNKQEVDELWEGATKTCTEGRPLSEQLDSNILELYNIEIEEHLGSGDWLDQLCKLDMGQCRPSEEGEELYCRCIEALHRREMKPSDVLMHVEMGVSQLPFSCRLHFMEAQFRLLFGIDDPRSSLRQCIINFYRPESGETISDDVLLQLYRHRLKLPMPLDFKPPPSSPGAPAQLREDNKTYMWLCYIMLTNFILGERSACEAFESALVMVQGRKDLELIWIEYLRFVASKTKLPSHDSISSLAKLVHRCLLSTATQYPLPFSRSGETWNDFSFHNRVIALYIEQVHDRERMEEYERLQLQMQDNVILAYRACQYAVESGFSQLGLQIAFSALHRSPDCVIFWKIVISLALQSQRYKEAHSLYEQAVLYNHTASSLWKDFIAFVIAHDDEATLRNLLQRCQEIGFQQSDVLPGAPIT